MRIGFFGGCFNPPTNIHIGIAKELIDSKILDKVIFVPVGDFYKKENLISAIHRYEMIKKAITNEANLEVDDIEIKEKQELSASDVFKKIEEKYQDVDRYFILGSDNFMKIETWKNYQEIIEKYKYLVILRNNDQIKEKRGNVIVFKPLNSYKYDSTFVRNLISEGLDPSEYINKDVYNYILKNKLYNKIN